MSPFCANCGANIEITWNNCPECGGLIKDQLIPEPGQTLYQSTAAPISRPSPQQVQQRPVQYGARPGTGTNGYGIVALICALVGLCFLSYIFGPIAIIIGAMGRTKDDSPGLATAGLVLGIFDLCCGILALLMLPILLQSLYYF